MRINSLAFIAMIVPLFVGNSAIGDPSTTVPKYEPTWESLNRHEIPQ